MRVVALLLLATLAAAQNLPLPPLPYAYDALEPHMDERTLRVHHLGHHQTYTDKLNVALATLRADEATKHLAKLGIDRLLLHLDEISDDSLRTAIRNNGGGYVNHDFFWHSMSPSGGGRPMGSLQAAITASFHSFEGFQSVFTSAATQLFGSGYVWLVARVQDHQKQLNVITTLNQDVPGSQWTPLLVLDVWEHAYYLKYQNKRADFIAGWWDIVNWDVVQQRLDAIPSA